MKKVDVKNFRILISYQKDMFIFVNYFGINFIIHVYAFKKNGDLDQYLIYFADFPTKFIFSIFQDACLTNTKDKSIEIMFTTCSEGYFTCNDGQCIHRDKRYKYNLDY